MATKVSPKPQAWTLFDKIVRDRQPAIGSTPWTATSAGELSYAPDYETLCLLLRVPDFLSLSSTSGMPAMALDVWVASELRRAGFDKDAVWPRAEVPRVLPAPFVKLLGELNHADRAKLLQILSTGKTYNGAVGASARIMGKNYLKQVDIVMADWDTGPELLISTKRMDGSYANNAPNRVEESYGDAKNLRSRHPLAALGFVFSLRSDAFFEAPRVAAWILDLLAKLGREDDAYDSVLLVAPVYRNPPPPGPEIDAKLLEPLVEAGLDALPNDYGVPMEATAKADRLYDAFLAHQPVELALERVPPELSAEVFFATMVRRVLDNSPITRHDGAREKIEKAILLPLNPER